MFEPLLMNFSSILVCKFGTIQHTGCLALACNTFNCREGKSKKYYVKPKTATFIFKWIDKFPSVWNASVLIFLILNFSAIIMVNIVKTLWSIHIYSVAYFFHPCISVLRILCILPSSLFHSLITYYFMSLLFYSTLLLFLSLALFLCPFISFFSLFVDTFYFSMFKIDI